MNKTINENIFRIKQLMNLTEDDNQLSLDFDYDENTIDDNVDNSKPIDVNSDEFTKKYKNSIFEILKTLYESTPNWSSDSSRGPDGKGGVINIHTVLDLFKKEGLDDYDEEGKEWSILNYFDTNPKVRAYLIYKWENETKKKIQTLDTSNEFFMWLENNKESLFKKGNFLNHMIKLNIKSLVNGEKNERKAVSYLTKMLEDQTDWEILGRFLPGSSEDRKGIDIRMRHKNGRIANFQVKPLGDYEKTKDGYLITSYNISQLGNKPVDYFIFASYSKENVYIFKKIEGSYKVLSETQILLKNPPIETLKK